jgi:hypothetical protein
MPMDAVKIAAAVSGGLSIVCATCEKYWEARDRNVPDDLCLAVDGCGSPIAGDVFHEYRGPMTQFDSFCFVCGNRATHAVRVDGNVRVIGVCAGHMELVKTLKPEGKRAPNVVVISKDGEKRISEDDAPEKRTPLIKFRGSSSG